MLSHLSSKERLGYSAIAALLMMFAGYVGARHLKQPSPIEISGAVAGAGGESSSQVAVDVVGAVARPGVLHLPGGSRVSDAIEAAGGGTPAADTMRLNLAAILLDGSQLTVPSKNDASAKVEAPYQGGSSSLYAKASEPAAGSPSQRADAGSAPNGLVSLSSGSAKELESVPGIGPATSARILEYRATHGAFRSVDELLAIKGIGPKKLEQMRRYLKP